MAKRFTKREWQKQTTAEGLPPYLSLTVLILGGQPTSVDKFPPEGLLPIDELDHGEQNRLCRLVDRYAAQHRRVGDARAVRDYCGLTTDRPAYASERSWNEPSSFDSMWELIMMMRDDIELHEKVLDLYRAPDYTVDEYYGCGMEMEDTKFAYQ